MSVVYVTIDVVSMSHVKMLIANTANPMKHGMLNGHCICMGAHYFQWLTDDETNLLGVRRPWPVRQLCCGYTNFEHSWAV